MAVDYRAVLFDMDGVVVDTDEAVMRFWTCVADPNGNPVSRCVERIAVP